MKKKFKKIIKHGIAINLISAFFILGFNLQNSIQNKKSREINSAKEVVLLNIDSKLLNLNVLIDKFLIFFKQDKMKGGEKNNTYINNQYNYYY